MAIVIDLKMGSKQTDKALDRLSFMIAKLDSVMSRYNGTLLNTTANLNRATQAQTRYNGAASRSPGASGGGYRGKAPPFLNPQSVMAANRAGVMAGDPNSMRLYRQAMTQHNAQQRLQTHATNAGMTPYQQAFMRTRFAKGSLGGLKAMPLGRDLGTMFGGGGGGLARAIMPLLANPVGIAAVVTLAAAAAGVVAAHAGAGAIGANTRRRTMMGGSQGQNEVASIQLRALGLGDDAARQFQSNIESGGIAGGYASREGINIVGGPHGDMNYADKINQMIEGIRNSSSKYEAKQKAEGVGMPELAEAYGQDQDFVDRMKKRLGTAEENPEDAKAAQDYKNSVSELEEGWDKLKRHVAAPYVKSLSAILNGKMPGLMDMAGMIMPGAVTYGKNGKEGKAKDEHTKAMENHTRMMGDHIEVLGGDARARGVIPRRVRGMNPESMEYARLNPI